MTTRQENQELLAKAWSQAARDAANASRRAGVSDSVHKVIGHTASGKEVRGDRMSTSKAHAEWSKADHKEAAGYHIREAEFFEKHNDKERANHHYQTAEGHIKASKEATGHVTVKH